MKKLISATGPNLLRSAVAQMCYKYREDWTIAGQGKLPAIPINPIFWKNETIIGEYNALPAI